MTRTEIPTPGLFWGDYPERRPPARSWRLRCANHLRDIGSRLLDSSGALQRRQDAAFVHQVRLAQQSLRADMPRAVQNTRSRLLHEGFTPAALVQALACVSLAAEWHLGVSAFNTQLIAARAVLNNQLAEMATGEGKTLAVALAAAAAALAGMPVHVVTANDYLVVRDATRMAPLYSALGLRVGHVVQPDAAAARIQAYACDITYVSAKELVFDYLRDQLSAQAGAGPRRCDAPAAALARLQTAPAHTAPPALLRGLCMAIVDEADAVLIDEARVPLILSQATPLAATQEHAQQALQFARTLHWGVDFQIDSAAMSAVLTDAGRARLQGAAASLHGASAANAWRHTQHREHAVAMALVALHALQNERHYLVRESKGQRQVQIIDAGTGRIAEGRAWSQGLQQMVEAKEACAPSPALATLAQLTFQRFFARYLRMGGLSGTLSEARGELMAHYGTAVRRVPLRRPSLRQVWRTRLYKDAATLRAAVLAQVEQLHQAQRPVMVATDSVADAQALSLCLKAQALPHDLLHARNDADEAQIVARAGQPGAITVTTNIAGRGTDIELGPGVAARGGLFVICCQLNSARRIDRQLAGRAARQGDPGAVQTLLSLDNALLAQSYPAALRRVLAPCASALPSWAVRALVRAPQWALEQNQRLQRQRLIAQDERLERQLAFAGAFE